MKPCLGVLGAKVSLARHITSLLPEHDSYVEPYAGSAAVLLAKDPVNVETINDKDQLLVTFYRTLRAEATRYRLIDALTYTPYSRAESKLSVDDPTLDDVERSRRFMVRTNQGYHGGGGWVLTRRGSSGHSNATKWNNYRTRLSSVAERLQNVQLECRDALEVIAQMRVADDPKIAFYVDPPYLMSTRNGAKYTSDMGAVRHHQLLLDDLVRITGPVVLSAYPSDLYDELLGPKGAGWTQYQIAHKASSSAGKGRVAERTEVLWANPQCLAASWVEQEQEPLFALDEEEAVV